MDVARFEGAIELGKRSISVAESCMNERERVGRHVVFQRCTLQPLQYRERLLSLAGAREQMTLHRQRLGVAA